VSGVFGGSNGLGYRRRSVGRRVGRPAGGTIAPEEERLDFEEKEN